MPLVTYGYHTAPANPDSIEIDGVIYDRIERLPRNLRPGDLLAIGDNTDRAGYHRAYVTITDVESYPQEIQGWHRYAPTCIVHFRLPEGLLSSYRWQTWGNTVKFRDEETKRRVTWAYRARTSGRRCPAMLVSEYADEAPSRCVGKRGHEGAHFHEEW
jgi:hypothetical protein